MEGRTRTDRGDHEAWQPAEHTAEIRPPTSATVERRPDLDELVVKSRPIIEAYVARRVSRRDHREEIVSRVYAALVRSWPSFRGDCSATGYVLTIAAHALANYYARDLARERKQISLEAWSEEFHLQQSGGPPGPQEQVERRDEISGLLAEMRKVCSADQCTVIELVYQGHTMEQIGTLLNLPPATIRSHFLRGRARLLAHLLIAAPDYLGGPEAVDAAVRRLQLGAQDALSPQEADAVRKRQGPAEVLRRAMLKIAPYLGVGWLMGAGT